MPRKTTTSTAAQQTISLKHRCPKCHAASGKYCIDMRTRDCHLHDCDTVDTIKDCHIERFDAAVCYRRTE